MRRRSECRSADPTTGDGADVEEDEQNSMVEGFPVQEGLLELSSRACSIVL